MEDRRPGAKETQAPLPAEAPQLRELKPNIYQFRSEKPGSHVYLVKGDTKNILIDTGVATKFPILEAHLAELKLSSRDIHLVLLTHEHFDHIGATAFFHGRAVVAAHRLAANKVELQDEFVTFDKYLNIAGKRFRVDIWLEDGTEIDLGNYKFKVIHTPGHTSGCICLYEPTQGLLFTGDTVFAGGTLSEIWPSGNISDYVNSVQRLNSLRVKEVYPGHGKLSDAPDQDLPKAVECARRLLDDSKAFFEAFTMTRKLQQKRGFLGGYWEET